MCGIGMAGMAGVSALGMAFLSTLGLGALAATVWLVTRFGGRGWQGGVTSAQAARLLSAEEILRERYARGEIDIETLRNMLAELYRAPDAR